MCPSIRKFIVSLTQSGQIALLKANVMCIRINGSQIANDNCTSSSNDEK